MKSIIEVSVKSGKENKIIGIENNKYTVMINSKPVDGEANKELIKFLSRELNKKLVIYKGFRNKKKLLQILE